MAGCAAVPVVATMPENIPHTLTNTEIIGRFSAQFSLDDGKGGVLKDSANGRFNLTNNNQVLALELSSPFGQTLAKLSQSQNLSPVKARVWMASPQEREWIGDSLERLSAQALGWPVPVERLHDWLRELQASSAGQSEQRSDARWQLQVEDRFDSSMSLKPRLMTLKTLGSALPQVQLRLIIEAWE